MKKPYMVFALILISHLLLLSACNGKVSAASREVTIQVPVQPVTSIPTATQTSILQPTATMLPTATVLPSAIPVDNPEDPLYWALEGQPDPYQAGYLLYTLPDQQKQYALQPIREFYHLMYHNNALITPDQARMLIDPASIAWTDPQEGFQVSYNSFAQVGYYPYYEFPIEDAAHYTDWRVNGVKTPDGQFYVVVSFRFEQQGFTVMDQTTQKPVVSTPYWGPRLMVLETAFRDGRWLIITRHEEDLGITATPTPTG